ncbi:hypothetical protein [Cyanobium sp. Morenito 9A2]|nr:hypothetical protein [Cyanobium sp. Morenito 9A2]MCP9848481.1 hypothetical protein [Cyanobium sp. Morenito 9A2]
MDLQAIAPAFHLGPEPMEQRLDLGHPDPKAEGVGEQGAQGFALLRLHR